MNRPAICKPSSLTAFLPSACLAVSLIGLHFTRHGRLVFTRRSRPVFATGG